MLRWIAPPRHFKRSNQPIQVGFLFAKKVVVVLSIGHSNVQISNCLKRQKHQAKAPTIKQKTWAENINLNPPGTKSFKVVGFQLVFPPKKRTPSIFGVATQKSLSPIHSSLHSKYSTPKKKARGPNLAMQKKTNEWHSNLEKKHVSHGKKNT